MSKNDEFGLLEWQKAIRHFMVNNIVESGLELSRASKRMAALERFVRDELTTDKLREFCNNCPFRKKGE